MDSIRRLVHGLCERGQTLHLCSLPFKGRVRVKRTPPSSLKAPPPPQPSALGDQMVVGEEEEEVVEGHRDQRRRVEVENDDDGGGQYEYRWVPFIHEVVEALERRAINLDPNPIMGPGGANKPSLQPYQALYDLFVSRGDMRGAAGAMMCWARRLRGEGGSGEGARRVHEVLAAYGECGDLKCEHY